jgi:photosystem II stability/assembly factor-like uncharacterized protein
MASAATAADVGGLSVLVLGDAGIGWSDGVVVATLAALVADVRVVAIGLRVVGFEPDELAAVVGVARSQVSLEAVGTPSVAEAAALLAVGAGGRLVVPKRRAGLVTAAVAVPNAHLGAR